jgi:zinc transport system substrate-binding protein
MRKIIKVMGVVLAALFVFTACSTEENNAESVSEPAADSEKTQIMTSIYPVYEITKEIAGDRADVSLMVGENEDAHHYEPSAQAVASVNEADVFIYSSEQMEFWAESLLNVVENEDLQVIELAEGLDLDIGEAAEHDHDHEHEEAGGHDHDHGGLDPHFWLDPVAVKEQLPFIVEALSQKDPENESYYVENQNDFADELSTLDAAYQEAFADAENREFVVQHQAFGHLANRYHLDQVAVGGLTTEVEPDPQQLSRIINFIKEEEVPVVYYQSGENSAIAETIAQESGTEIGVLYDLENKPVDSDLAEDSYIEMMEQNLEELQKSIH